MPLFVTSRRFHSLSLLISAVPATAVQVNCVLSIDNAIQGVWLNGKSVSVSGDAGNWAAYHSISFNVEPAERSTLAIQGYEYSHCNGCGCSGLGLSCSSSYSPWDSVRSDTSNWLAYGSSGAGPSSTDWKLPYGDTSQFSSPCQSHSGFYCNGCSSYTKIWASNGNRYSYFVMHIGDSTTTTTTTTRARCGPGEYFLIDQNTCGGCPDGEFNSLLYPHEATTCSPHSLCAAGEEVITAGTSTADTVCQNCSAGHFRTVDMPSCILWATCPVGEQPANVPTASSDRLCKICDADISFKSSAGNFACAPVTQNCSAGYEETEPPSTSQDRVCSSCVAGHFSPTGEACIPHAVCNAGQYISREASAVTDRECTTCPAETFNADPRGSGKCEPWRVCQPGTVGGPGSPSADRICAPCDSGATFQSKAGELTCELVRTCGGAEVEVVAPAADRNRECAFCPTGKYKAGVSKCLDAKTCTPGSREIMPPSFVADRECMACEPGSAQPKANRRDCIPCIAGVSFAVTSGSRICSAVTSCRYGYISSPATTVNDLTCSPLTDCNVSEFESTSPSITEDRICSSATVCSSHQYEIVPLGARNDRMCKNLTVCIVPDEYQSNSPSSIEDRLCEPTTKCRTNEIVGTPPTATSNRMCLSPSKSVLEIADGWAGLAIGAVVGIVAVGIYIIFFRRKLASRDAWRTSGFENPLYISDTVPVHEAHADQTTIDGSKYSDIPGLEGESDPNNDGCGYLAVSNSVVTDDEQVYYDTEIKSLADDDFSDAVQESVKSEEYEGFDSIIAEAASCYGGSVDNITEITTRETAIISASGYADIPGYQDSVSDETNEGSFVELERILGNSDVLSSQGRVPDANTGYADVSAYPGGNHDEIDKDFSTFDRFDNVDAIESNNSGIIENWWAKGMTSAETSAAVLAGENGSFLFRRSRKPGHAALFVNSFGVAVKYSVMLNPCTFAGETFECLSELVVYLQTNPISVKNGDRNLKLSDKPAPGGVCLGAT